VVREFPFCMDPYYKEQYFRKEVWLIDIYRFLLVSLGIEAILREPTIHRRREGLSNMIDLLGFEDIYHATIERIKALGGYKSAHGMGTLRWINYAEEPLSPDDLCHGLAAEPDSTDFNAGNIPSVTTLLEYCRGFISVDKDACRPGARLIHFTLKEYFSVDPRDWILSITTTTHIFDTLPGIFSRISASRSSSMSTVVLSSLSIKLKNLMIKSLAGL